MLLEYYHSSLFTISLILDDEIQGSILKIWQAISDFVDLIEKKMNQYCPNFRNVLYKLVREYWQSYEILISALKGLPTETVELVAQLNQEWIRAV
jgi:hypothetical protein